ncbi:hypothetical protein ACKFKG_24360 [Phormidesmis sp. 146-35]
MDAITNFGEIHNAYFWSQLIHIVTAQLEKHRPSIGDRLTQY